MTKNDFLARIKELLQLKWNGPQQYDILAEVYTGTIAIATQLWGANGPQAEAVKQLYRDCNLLNGQNRPRQRISSCNAMELFAPTLPTLSLDGLDLFGLSIKVRYLPIS